ncbi:MAG: outer membrane protein [Bacteroidota bacterium]|nr:outer membrane protein [Bacteroidota bacterium]
MRPVLFFFLLCAALTSTVFAKSSYTVQNNALVLPGSIQFDQHNYDVKDTLDPMLDLVAEYLKENPSITKLRIEGHVYTEKTPELNVKLSLQRAAIISYYLTTKGIACNRLIPVAFGDTKPIAPTDECNVMTNTRIDFYNAEYNHKAVPGNAVDGFALKVFEPCE